MEPIKEPNHENQEKKSAVSEKVKATPSSILAALFNGMGVGLLIGVLLGLAVSPVVSAFIGTLSSLLILLIGLNENFFTIVKSVRIGGFGVFAVAGILLGLYLRSHSPLAPSLMDLKVEYKALGYSEKEIRDFIAYQEFGLIPIEWTGRIASKTDSSGLSSTHNLDQQDHVANQVKLAKRNNILFSSEVNAGQCFMLESSNENMSLSDIQLNYEAAGGSWEKLAFGLDASLPESIRVKTLLIVRDVICNSGSSGKITFDCNGLSEVLEQQDTKHISSMMRKSDNLWGSLLNEIDTNINSQYHKAIYLSLIKIFCHEEN